jgi:AcrR family transcriptional regulator
VKRPVTRNDYFDAALAILSADGFGGLKQAALCKALRVTTGSFYHCFDSWQEFKTAFLGTWLQQRTTQLVELAAREAEPVARLSLLEEFAATLPHRAEAAIRAWAACDKEVADVQLAVDQQRHDVVRGAMTEILGESAEAENYTLLGLYILAGYQQLQPPQDVAGLRWALTHLIEDVVGVRGGEKPAAARRSGE